MKKTLLVLIILVYIFPMYKAFFGETSVRGKKPFNYSPSEWFYYQRAYPNEKISQNDYDKVLNLSMERQNKKSSFTQDWVAVGPSNIGGRITALAVDPVDNIIYIGAAAGGIFKSTDLGETFLPKTDFYPSLSIGSLRIDPNNRNIIYCGTGEANSSGDSYPGFGLLKSTDYGETWNLIGLEKTRHIAQIQVHPLNSNIIYVAASGHLYSNDTIRGIYKSTDAGLNWNRVLFVNDSTAAIDVDVDPTDINIVYATFFERMRSRTYRKAAGKSSGIYKTTDGGNTWAQMTNGLPAGNPKIGRISVAVAKSNSNYVYALYKEAETNYGTNNGFHGFFRSTNKGNSWTKMPNGNLPGEFSSFGWYFGLIDVDPTDHNKVYIGEVDLMYSPNGGNSWTNITNAYSVYDDSQHPDQHSLWINPDSPEMLINGNDGGLFITTNRGSVWRKCYDLPISQFYASTVAEQNPNIVAGGTQDNGTMMTRNGGYNNWEAIYGGDGFHTKIDYNDSKYMYACYQNGGLGRSEDGGLSFYSATNGLDLARTNWSSPYILDPLDPTILYFGSYKLHKSVNRAQSWTAISPDLTRGANGRMGTITCISAEVLPNQTNRVIYIGTDDGKLSVSTNSGATWTDKTNSLPNRYITDVLADKRNPATAYVTLSGFNMDLTNPHIFRTTNFGDSWIDISGNLPDVPLNSVAVDLNGDSVLYVGGDLGVYFTKNLGITWEILGNRLPNSPIADLNYHKASNQLFAATHGRSIFKLDISGITSADYQNNNEFLFKIENNFPNPFNPSTVIKYTVKKRTNVLLKVFNLSGEEIVALVNEEKPEGEYSISFDGKNLPTGVYIAQIIAGDFKKSIKMLLLK